MIDEKIKALIKEIQALRDEAEGISLRSLHTRYEDEDHEEIRQADMCYFRGVSYAYSVAIKKLSDILEEK